MLADCNVKGPRVAEILQPPPPKKSDLIDNTRKYACTKWFAIWLKNKQYISFNNIDFKNI